MSLKNTFLSRSPYGTILHILLINQEVVHEFYEAGCLTREKRSISVLLRIPIWINRNLQWNFTTAGLIEAIASWGKICSFRVLLVIMIIITFLLTSTKPRA